MNPHRITLPIEMHRTTLRAKILGIVGLALLSSIVVIYTITQTVMLKSFAELEKKTVLTDIGRVRDALTEEIGVIETKGKDWGAWDDTAVFVRTRNKAYAESNLTFTALSNIKINFMLFYDKKGRLVCAKGADMDKARETSVSKDVLDFFTLHKALLNCPEPSRGKSGLVVLPSTQALVTVWPISNSQEAGPVNGTLVMGRFLSDADIEDLGARTHLQLTLTPIWSAEAASPSGTLKSLPPDKPRNVVEPISADRIAGYALLTDILGLPNLFLKIEMPRDIMRHGRVGVGYVLLSVAAVGALLLCILMAALHFTVLGPVSLLTRHVASVGETQDLHARLNLRSHDEIGTLGRAFDNMVEALETGIAERERARQHLVESEEKFSRLFEAESHAIFLLDTETGRFLDANPAAQRLYGYTRDEALAMNRDAVLGPTKLLEVGSNGLSDGAHIHAQRRKDGACFPAEISTASFQWQGREVNTITVRNMTDRAQAEKERRKLEAHLRDAQKMKAVGELAGGIAHDFNNLLQVIMGHAERLADKGQDIPLLSCHLPPIVKASERARLLVRQLLTFSRRQSKEHKEIHLSSSIRDFITMLRPMLGEKMEVEFVPDDSVASVSADPSGIDQILMNLCVNSRDSMPDGGKIIIETGSIFLDSSYCAHHPWASEGAFVTISVSDTGCGIPKDLQERIFEPFFTTKEVGKGTGLGLSTVYGIVKQHDGLVSVYSEEDVGTTFRVYLPLADAASEIHAEVEARSLAPAANGTETILIAEDEGLIREMVGQILSEAGYGVLVAADGVEAIRLVENESARFDMALLDVIMPKANGKEVYDKIKLLRPTVPVLFSTGYSRNILDAAFTPEEKIDLIDKPYNPSDLLRCIREILDRVRV